MKNGCAVQIVEHFGKSEFKIKNEVLKEIYGDERVSDLPLVVLCIAGAARKGKSFMLNFFLDYLIHKEKYPNVPWTLNETTQLVGFEFQEGEDRATLGIWAWDHVFIVENNDGKKVAVSLIDSQGTFDRNTSYEDCSALFAMTSMFSSVMCFNVFTDLQEDKLNDFAAFIDHGKNIVENLGGSEKLFQSLVFIIRDFNFKKYLDDENGGQKYIEKQLADVSNEDLQKVRDNLKESCERMFGFIFPYPGPKVAQVKTSNISEMDPVFVTKAKHMVEFLLSQKNIQTKKLGSSQFLCKDMINYIQLCIQCFNDHPKFAPQAVQTVNREFMIDLEVKRALKVYESVMDRDFLSCKVGFKPKDLLQKHDNQLSTIKKDISKQIKNNNICSAVVDRLMEEVKHIFKKFEETNSLLVENEKKRKQQLAQQEATHLKELEKQKEENDRKMKEEAAKIQRDNEIKMKEETARIQKENDRKLEEEKQRQAQEIQRIQRENAAIIASLGNQRIRRHRRFLGIRYR